MGAQDLDLCDVAVYGGVVYSHVKIAHVESCLSISHTPNNLVAQLNTERSAAAEVTIALRVVSGCS